MLVIVILFAFPGPRHLIVTSLEMAAAAAAGAFIAAMFFLPKKRS